MRSSFQISDDSLALKIWLLSPLVDLPTSMDDD
jgi:hypothetical protein